MSGNSDGRATAAKLMAAMLLWLWVSPPLGLPFGRVSSADAIGALVFTALPLAGIFYRVLATHGRQGLPAALVCSLAGFPFTYAWVKRGDEHILVWGIAFLTYWAVGLVTLLSPRK